MIKKVLPFIICFTFSQDLYNGLISFQFSGNQNGTFNANSQNPLDLSGALNISSGDSSQFIISGVSNNSDNTVNVFLAVLQDTTFPIQPRSWSIPGNGEISDPLSLESILIFAPNIDSSFANLLNSILTDSTVLTDSLLLTFIDKIYVGISGSLELFVDQDSLITGNFNSVLTKAELSFPPDIVTISNGEFTFSPLSAAQLSNRTSKELPNKYTIHPIYPNPFNPSFNISYNHSAEQNINISIYNLNGKKIKTILNEFQAPGQYNYNYTAKELSSGFYLIRYQGKYFSKTQKISFIK